MAVCAKAVLQPDGSYLFALDPAAPDLMACQYVIQSGVETKWAFLSIEEASVIALAISLLWAVAWGFRQIVHAINFDRSENE